MEKEEDGKKSRDEQMRRLERQLELAKQEIEFRKRQLVLSLMGRVNNIIK